MKKAIFSLITILVVIGASVTVFTQQTEAPASVTTPIYDINGHRLNAHGVVGQVSVPVGAGIALIPVTFAGEAAFANANSYQCFTPQLFGPTFNMVDGAHLTIKAPRSDAVFQLHFFCIGS